MIEVLLKQLKEHNLLLKNEPFEKIIEYYSSKKNKIKDVLKFLYKNGYINKKTYLMLLKQKFKFDYLENIDKTVNLNTLKIPFKFFKEYKFLIYKIVENKVYVLISQPQKINFIRILNQYFQNKEFIYLIVTEEDLEQKIKEKEYEYLLNEYIRNTKKELEEISGTEVNNDNSINKLIHLILKIAIEKKTSDIHIEASEKKGKIRFRILGTLSLFLEIDKDIYNAIISTIKLLSKLDISNKFTPQDGAFSLEINETPFDFRVSTLPTIWGESCVIRILNKSNILKNVEEIGISEENLIKIKRIINSPNGIFLVTGPTGSGKSTTLYGILNSLDREKLKIITVEDPVEYKLEGIEQVQVNEKKDLTFAKALRSILRQDPDVIMIGEIRDKETLEIAIKASLTGHLVISTLHTNDAISAINRMIDMGVEPYLVASALLGVEAQRLVKTICPYCKQEYQPNKTLIEAILPFFPKNFKFYKGKGCDKCNYTGFIGRTLITEVFIKDSELEELIIKNKSKKELLDYLKNNANYSIMFFDGIKKVLNGETTIEEVFKVSNFE